MRSDILNRQTEITFSCGTELSQAKMQAANLAIERHEAVFFRFNGKRYGVGPSDIQKAVNECL